MGASDLQGRSLGREHEENHSSDCAEVVGLIAKALLVSDRLVDEGAGDDSENPDPEVRGS